jgi:hypothetical protein
MDILILILCSLFIVYCAKNKTIDGNTRTVSILVAAILALLFVIL